MRKVILIAIIGSSFGASLGSRLSKALEENSFKILDSHEFDSYNQMLKKARKVDKSGIYFQKQKYIPPKSLGRKYLSNYKRRY